MRRVFKWLGYVVVAIVAVIAIALGYFYARSSARINRTYPRQTALVAIPSDSASLERGRHLVFAVAKCAGCHGDNLAGKVIADDPKFAVLWSANLTRGKGGIGTSYTDSDYIRTIRWGVKRDGKPVIFMPSEAYTHFSDADLGAIIAYVKSVPPVDQENPKMKIGPIARIVSTISAEFPLASAEHIDRNASHPQTVTPAPTAEYGNYLVTTGACKSCHNANLSGGGKVENVTTRNLTPAALGNWSEADFARVLRTGVRPNGQILSAVMPYAYTKNLTDEEIHAMWLYLRSIPARPTGG